METPILIVQGLGRLDEDTVPPKQRYQLIPLPDPLTERQVQEYILYVRDDLGVAKGTFAPLLAGLKFFYLNTLGYEWPLLTKKKSASHARSGCPTSAATRIVAA